MVCYTGSSSSSSSSAAAAAAALHDDTSVSQLIHVVNPVNDEAIAMVALSSMADCTSSSQFAPGTEQLPACVHQISSEHVTTYMEQISSEQITSETLQMAVDLSSANVDESLT